MQRSTFPPDMAVVVIAYWSEEAPPGLRASFRLAKGVLSFVSGGTRKIPYRKVRSGSRLIFGAYQLPFQNIAARRSRKRRSSSFLTERESGCQYCDHSFISRSISR